MKGRCVGILARLSYLVIEIENCSLDLNVAQKIFRGRS